MKSKREDRNLKALFGYVLRLFLSTLPISLYHDQFFQKGVTFTILTKNDPWFLESIFSIYKYADEIVIIDSSDNKLYSEYNELVINKLKEKVIIKHLKEKINIIQGRRKALKVASNETIVHWDADMIAYDTGKNDFSNVLSLIKDLGNKKKIVFFELLNICQDLNNVAIKPVDYEPWIFSKTRKELYRPRSGNLTPEKMVEGFTAPKYFRRLNLKFFGAIHMKWVMPPEKALYKEYQGYLLNKEFMVNYGDYNNLKSKLNSYVPNVTPTCIPYDETAHGKYPICLKRFIGLTYNEIINKKLEELQDKKIPIEINEKLSNNSSQFIQ